MENQKKKWRCWQKNIVFFIYNQLYAIFSIMTFIFDILTLKSYEVFIGIVAKSKYQFKYIIGK